MNGKRYRVTRVARGLGFHLQEAARGDVDTDIPTGESRAEAVKLFGEYAASRYEAPDANVNYWAAARSWAETQLYRLGRPMKTDPKTLSAFRAAYFDYREGLSETQPSMDDLNAKDRKTVERWLMSLEVARGIDPFTTRPSTPELMARIRERESDADRSTE